MGRIGHTPPITCRAVAQKLETQNQKEDQISIRTTPDNAESEVFSDSRRFFFHDFLARTEPNRTTLLELRTGPNWTNLHG